MTDAEILAIGKVLGHSNIPYEGEEGSAFLSGWRACEREIERQKEGRRDKPIGICVECSSDIYRTHEMLPEYPGLYECPSCGHPNIADKIIFEGAEQSLG
jgi:hypothetical protein